MPHGASHPCTSHNGRGVNAYHVALNTQERRPTGPLLHVRLREPCLLVVLICSLHDFQFRHPVHLSAQGRAVQRQGHSARGPLELGRGVAWAGGEWGATSELCQIVPSVGKFIHRPKGGGGGSWGGGSAGGVGGVGGVGGYWQFGRGGGGCA